jgi:hypothetical protein
MAACMMRLASAPASLASGDIVAAASSAAYTLLGVVITGVVTLLAVVAKYAFDSRADSRRYKRELEVNALEHAREVEKLKMQLNETRRDVLRDLKRRAFALYLAETHAIYLSAIQARRQRREDADNVAYQRALKAVAPMDGQVALEECRLLVPAGSADRAEALWAHLRSHPVAMGIDLSSSAWSAWKKEYWELRRALIEQWKLDLEMP